VKPLLSRKLARHYGGFAMSQLRAFDEKPSAKRALYVLRTAATGRHAMEHGEIVTDVARLSAFVPPEITELLAIKQRGERQELAPEQISAWRGRLSAAIDAVDAAWPTSILPPEAPVSAVENLDRWLRDVRKSHW
jgi:predicted nucleotidyltransferase